MTSVFDSFPLASAANAHDDGRREQYGTLAASAPPRGLDRGDVDLLHRHHRREGPLCLVASCCHGIRQHARRDLPREAPAVLAPSALTLPAAIADDRVPIAVRFLLIVRRDL